MEITITGRCDCGDAVYEAQGPILHQGTCTCPGLSEGNRHVSLPNVRSRPSTSRS